MNAFSTNTVARRFAGGICIALTVGAGHASTLGAITGEGDVSPRAFPNDVTSLAEAIIVGDIGSGSLTLIGRTPTSDVARLTSPTGLVGRETTGIGSVEVDGPAASWTTAQLQVGSHGVGNVLIRGGGEVSSGFTSIAFHPQSSGSISVIGNASSFTVGLLSIGRQGSGSLVVTQGGSVTSGFSYIGDSPGGIGNAMVSGPGSHWSVGDDLTVARNGQGSLLIAGGGSVDVMGDATIGMNQSSAGSVTVRGVSSRWTIDGRLLVSDFGDFGYGRLTIEDGGEVVVLGGDDRFFFSDGITVARGNVQVSGRSSRLKAAHGVSLSGDGSVDVLNEAIVESAFLRLSGGSVRLSNQASWFISQDAHASFARIEVTDGSRLESRNASLGANPVSELAPSSINVLHDSNWTNHGELAVIGQSTLNAGSGGVVQIGERLHLGELEGARGTVRVFSGFAQFPAGAVVVGEASPRDGHLTVGSGGRLDGTGAVDAPVENSGVVWPGPVEAFEMGARLTINGSYRQSSQGTLTIRLHEGTDQIGGLTIHGEASLAGDLSLVQSGPLESRGITTLSILSADHVVGTFDRVPEMGQNLGSGAYLRGIRYKPTNVEVDVLQPLWGDHNASGHISQADLDLVLLNWGSMTADVPAAWAADRPVGRVGQLHLDRVLLHWGENASFTVGLRGKGVPEPSSLCLMLSALAFLILRLRASKTLVTNAKCITGDN